MSIEYTIDIQLTELGFPTDALNPPDTSVRDAPTSSDDCPSQPPIKRAVKRKQRLLVKEDLSAAEPKANSRYEQKAEISSPTPVTLPCKTIIPVRPQQDKTLITAPVDTDLLQPTPEQDQSTDLEVIPGSPPPEASAEEQQEEEGDSDDSDVSGVYEEEEEEDEEGLDSDSSQSGEYSCSVCSLTLPSKFKLQDHMNLHTGARPYCCAECGKRFCQISSYRVHLRTHAKSEVERLQCRICRKTFAYQEDLKHHLSINHWEDKFYECDLCKRVFTSLQACENHVNEYKCMQKIKCETCGRNFSSQKFLTQHQKKKCSHILRCTDCKKTFSKKNALLKHSFSHLGLLPYTCVQCSCHFRLAKLYLEHKCKPERIHCMACLREFVNEEDFERHKKDTGCWGNQVPKADEIRCLECGQRFETSEELKKHAGAHQRVLKCAECGKGFRSALLLMSHMGGHAGKSPCLCQSCGLGFPHQQNYDSHLKTCGQTPQPKSSSKKRKILKSSSSKTTVLNSNPDSARPNSSNPNPEPSALRGIQTKPDPSNITRTETTASPVIASENFASPECESYSPGEGVSSGSNSTDGLWKLTLDKQPPPGAKLMLFIPACATQSSEPALPSAQTPQGLHMQVQPQVAFSPILNEHLAVHASFGAPLNAPLNMVTRIKKDPDEAPLDLSKKSALREAPLSVKSEPQEFEIPSDMLNNSNTNASTDVKPIKMEALDLSTSSGLVMQIKNEEEAPQGARAEKA